MKTINNKNSIMIPLPPHTHVQTCFFGHELGMSKIVATFFKNILYHTYQDWREVLLNDSVDGKAETLHEMVLEKIDELFPEKTRKFASDDQPWVSSSLKRLDRQRRR